jgi:hypothetical protein
MAGWTLTDALQVLHQQYPGAFVTSGARDPNSALGLANPKSDHIGPNPHAFDVRPLKGVQFDDYVAGLRAAGLPVTKAFDEATHPFPWTTGPNWHVSFDPQKGKQVATSPIDMIRRAQAFNVNIPPEAMPPAGGPMSAAPDQQAQPNIADLISKLPGLQPLPADKPQKGSIWGAILGAISDGLLVGGGKDPIYAPSMLKRQQMQEDRDTSREKLNAEIAARRDSLLAKLMAGPQPTQTDRYIQQIIDPKTPPQLKAILRQVIEHPIAVPTYNADGSVQTNFYYPDTLPGNAQGGEDDWEYSD